MIFPVLNKLNNKKITFVPFALIGLTAFIPLSTSLAAIFWILALILIALTPFHHQHLRAILKTPLAWASIVFFLVALAGCFWGEVSLSIKLGMLSKYLKFLFFPLLIAGFSMQKTRQQVLHVFLAVMLLTAFLSFLKWTGVLIWQSPDPGEVFYNHIMTQLMMVYAAYIALWFAYMSKKILYALLFILFSFQILFISPGRTGYVLYAMLIALFCLQVFSFKQAVISLLIGFTVFTGIIYESPVAKEGVHHALEDIRHYKQHQLDTSLGFRVQFHHYAKELFYRHRLKGNGLGGFQTAYHKENPIPSWTMAYLLEPHSQYWLILSELGLLGFGALSLFLMALAWEIYKLKKMRILGVGIFVLFLLGNLTDSLFFYATTDLLFITMTALCLGEGLSKNYEH